MSAEDLACFLRRRMGELRLRNSDVANRAKIARQTWYRLLNAEIEEAKLSTLARLADALGLHVMSLLKVYYHGRSLGQASRVVSQKKYASGFVADLTYPDNSIVTVNEVFTKTWEVVNLGKEPWRGLFLQCVDDRLEVRVKPGYEAVSGEYEQYGLLPLAERIEIPETASGQSVQISVVFRAPPVSCTVVSHWKTFNAAGEIMFPNRRGLHCQVKVVSM